ncbi:MAG: hypothetical protein GF411_17125 [Candidatus Lokiarchaeota archaeon]|nr:hypothetical protein [Candidatus Lokiarchaeota archaeon]
MSGADNIIDMIREKAEKKAEKIILDAESQKTLRLKSAKQKAEEIAEEIRQKAETKTKSELSKYKASAKLKSKYRFLEVKEELIQNVLSEMHKQLEKKVKSKKYADVLESLAIQGGVSLGGGKLEIVLPSDIGTKPDTDKISKEVSKKTDEKTTVKISKETVRATGGLIIRKADGTKWVNNTFEGRRERLENEIRDKIASILFVKG